MDSGILVDVRELTKEYGTMAPTRVLHGIDLQVKPGEFMALIGTSGSGKSTLLNIIGALDRPTSGTVAVNNTLLHTLNKKELAYFRNQTIGFIFQFHFLLPEFNVLENVLIPHLIYAGSASPAIRARAMDLLDMMGLSHRASHRANAISGGEQQRVAVARALINNPRLVLADEPTGNLDSSATEKVFSLLRNINRNFKTAFLLVTHDYDLANRADRIIELKDGRVICDRRPGETPG